LCKPGLYLLRCRRGYSTILNVNIECQRDAQFGLQVEAARRKKRWPKVFLVGHRKLQLLDLWLFAKAAKA